MSAAAPHERRPASTAANPSPPRFRIDAPEPTRRPQILGRRAVAVGLFVAIVEIDGMLLRKLTPEAGTLRTREEFQVPGRADAAGLPHEHRGRRRGLFTTGRSSGTSTGATAICTYGISNRSAGSGRSSGRSGRSSRTGSSMVSGSRQKGSQLTRGGPPDWRRKDFYHWYYAMHDMGGEDRIWWNQRLRDVLLANPSRDGDAAGSRDPRRDQWAKEGGLVYVTALGALFLEVYYRFSESIDGFGTAPDLDELFLK